MSIFKDDYGILKFRWFVVAVIGLIAIFFSLAWEYQVSYYRDNCYNYSRNTGAEVKYERPRWGQAFCYVKTPNGWFQIEQVNQNSVSTELVR